MEKPLSIHVTQAFVTIKVESMLGIVSRSGSNYYSEVKRVGGIRGQDNPIACCKLSDHFLSLIIIRSQFAPL